VSTLPVSSDTGPPVTVAVATGPEPLDDPVEVGVGVMVVSVSSWRRKNLAAWVTVVAGEIVEVPVAVDEEMEVAEDYDRVRLLDKW